MIRTVIANTQWPINSLSVGSEYFQHDILIVSTIKNTSEMELHFLTMTHKYFQWYLPKVKYMTVFMQLI